MSRAKTRSGLRSDAVILDGMLTIRRGTCANSECIIQTTGYSFSFELMITYLFEISIVKRMARYTYLAVYFLGKKTSAVPSLPQYFFFTKLIGTPGWSLVIFSLSQKSSSPDSFMQIDASVLKAIRFS